MLKVSLSPLFRYSLAVLAVALALLATFLLQPLAQPTIYSLSFAAVIITAWHAGLGPGILATILAGLGIDYFFVGMPYAVDFDLAHLEQTGMFMIVAVVIGYLAAARRQMEERLRAAHHELELRVQERTKELARSNLELEERNKELWRLQGEMSRVEHFATLGRITGAIAHDLGTPLNSVLGYAHLLANEELPENIRYRLNIIVTQVERMVEILNQYLSQTRGSFQDHRQVNVNELVQETLELFKPIFERNGIRAITSLAESLSPVRGDETSLRRVLINLLDNAVDAMKKGGEITVATSASPASNAGTAGVSVAVTDTGAGIPPELLPRIFEFFVTTKSQGKGTGLGLAICQEIIKGHGGAIDISSRVGEWTTVHLFLPTGAPSELQELSGEKRDPFGEYTFTREKGDRLKGGTSYESVKKDYCRP